MIFFSIIEGAAPFLHWLKGWDTRLFLEVNTEWTGSFGDFIFPVLRYPQTWIPLYAALFFYAAWKFKWKSWSWVLMAVVCITVTDQVSSHILKGLFDRLRPCQDASLAGIARLLVDHCPGNASFPSSHAVNHFGIGVYFCYSLKPYFKKWSYLFLLWAAAICYAQVYVGVHYPLDVLGGSVLGIFLGGIMAFIFNKYLNFGKGELLKKTDKANTLKGTFNN
jgi:undecaprenyl-diphosphatase